MKARKLVLAVAITGTLTLAPVGWRAQAYGQTPATTNPGQKRVKDQGEYDLYNAILKDQNPRTRLEKLNQWEERYPSTDFISERRTLFVTTFTALGRAPETYTVKFTTTKGAFVVQVTRAWAPLGADRFFNLVQNGFYSDASIFRIVPGFLVQFGIAANPRMSQTWRNAALPDDTVRSSNQRGYLTFCSSGPNTRTTQVFINLNDNRRLDGQGYAPFGYVIEGMEVVEAFYGGYGESPVQARIEAEGNRYLSRAFPNLDRIRLTSLESFSPEDQPTQPNPEIRASRSEQANEAAPSVQLKEGQTPEEVEKLMGKPGDTINVQESLVYIYPAVKVIFKNGKLVDVQPRKP
jgi:peptidyl-prolyl cis-trans isomerase A (cyclophilin A)